VTLLISSNTSPNKYAAEHMDDKAIIISMVDKNSYYIYCFRKSIIILKKLILNSLFDIKMYNQTSKTISLYL